jgi:hypothetical protein
MAAKSDKKTAAGTRSATKTTTRRTTSTKPKAVTDEMVAERAYQLHLDDPSASDVENWLRAESELRPA